MQRTFFGGHKCRPYVLNQKGDCRGDPWVAQTLTGDRPIVLVYARARTTNLQCLRAEIGRPNTC